MTDRFDYFVVFAEMRTGSNFLEANLNAFGGITCHGEAFNPHFIGYPNVDNILGVTQAMREGDPARLIDTIKTQEGVLGGFRFFHDHDARAMDIALADPRCAKIILTRNPVDSYVSWKIAQATGQWKLTDARRRKDGKAEFDRDEFEHHLAKLQGFQVALLNTLQCSGQTAFYVAYEDLQSVEVMNGLAKYLGVNEALDSLDKKLKKQNPSPISDKVENFDAMEEALARLDTFNLTRTPNFEPRRGPVVPSYVACAQSPLLYMPVRGGPEAEVTAWMAALDGAGEGELLTKFNQKGLRQWKRAHTGHRSFTVLRHPAARAHHAFCTHILSSGEAAYADIRKTLRKLYKLPIPGQGPVEKPDDSYDRRAHREAFIAFLDFLKANLAGQTGVRIDSTWASAANTVQGLGTFAFPDFILREDEMEAYLPAIAHQVGRSDAPDPSAAPQDAPFALGDIYDAEIEARVADIYQRDYMMFGFGPWGDLT